MTELNHSEHATTRRNYFTALKLKKCLESDLDEFLLKHKL